METPAQRARRMRAEAQRRLRQNATPEQAANTRKDLNASRRVRRANATPAQTEARRSNHAAYERTRTANPTIRANVNAARRLRRANKSMEQTQRRNVYQAAYRTRVLQGEVAATQGVALNEELQGNVIQKHYCGEMNVICQFCKANHFLLEQPVGQIVYALLPQRTCYCTATFS